MCRILTITIFWLALVSTGFALSEEIQVTPNGLDQGEYVFSVDANAVKEGVAFHVVISKKGGDIPPHSNVGISVVKHWNGGSEILPAKPETKVTLKRGEPSWTADFVASSSLLQTAGASFVFTEYVYFGTAEFYEIRLQDFAPDQARLEAYLATLHVGMTPRDSERDLNRWDFIQFCTLSSILEHRHCFISLSDGSGVTLQYDEHYKLISWKCEKGQNTAHQTPTTP
jgi:hypothetical protein